jgi:hypothetical protein
VPLCPPQIPHNVIWDRTRAAAVRSRATNRLSYGTAQKKENGKYEMNIVRLIARQRLGKHISAEAYAHILSIVEKACLLIRCLAMNLLLRAYASTGVSLPSRCLAIGLYVTIYTGNSRKESKKEKKKPEWRKRMEVIQFALCVGLRCCQLLHYIYCRVISERWLGHGLIKVSSRNLPGGTEESHEDPQSG